MWPEPTHAPRDSEAVKSGRLKPWRSAAEIIDWSLPCPSIFDTKEEIKERYNLKAVRPLADNTMRRIIRGVDKFTIKSGQPYIGPDRLWRTKGTGPTGTRHRGTAAYGGRERQTQPLQAGAGTVHGDEHQQQRRSACR